MIAVRRMLVIFCCRILKVKVFYLTTVVKQAKTAFLHGPAVWKSPIVGIEPATIRSESTALTTVQRDPTLVNRSLKTLVAIRAGGVTVVMDTVEMFRVAGSRGLTGKIWFGGCLMANCMLKRVTLTLNVVEEYLGDDHPQTQEIHVSPGLEPFPLGDIEWLGINFKNVLVIRQPATLVVKHGGEIIHHVQLTFSKFVTALRNTSWCPKFNGRHLGLQPSAVCRMTGPCGNFVWNLFELCVNFVWASSEFCVNFMRISFKLSNCLNFAWISFELRLSFLRIFRLNCDVTQAPSLVCSYFLRHWMISFAFSGGISNGGALRNSQLTKVFEMCVI